MNFAVNNTTAPDRAIVTRRAALVGAIASSAAMVAPVAAHQQMTAAQRMQYHFDELAKVLAEGVNGLDDGLWEIRVRNRNPELWISRVLPAAGTVEWTKTISPERAAEYHILQTAVALARLNGGLWRAAIGEKHNCALAIQGNTSGSGAYLAFATGGRR